MARYATKVMRDVARWRERGWIAPEAEEAIRADLAARPAGIGLPQVLVMLGGVLLVAAALTFVAANWEAIPRIVRLTFLGTLLAGAHGLAAMLFLRGHAAIAQVAGLVGCGIYGASIMLVAQMYHVSGNPTDAVLFWGLGTLLAAVLYRSGAIWAFAFGLLTLWSGWIAGESDSVHWVYPLVILVMAGIAVWLKFAIAPHLVALASFGWIASVGPLEGGWDGYPIPIAIGLAFAIAGGAVMLMRREADDLLGELAPLALVYGAALTYFQIILLQFTESPSVEEFAILAVAGLALSLAVLVIGRLCDSRFAMWLGYLAFSGELIGVYFETVGTLLNTSVFFFTIGIVVIALGWLAMKLRRTPETAT